MIRAWPSLAVLAIVLFAIFQGCLLSGETLLDARDLYRYHPWTEVANGVGAEAAVNTDADAVFQFLPLLAWEAGEWRAGRFPLWCDEILGGVPLYADANASMLNPSRVFLLWLSPIRAWELGIALRLAMAFLFMRLFLRGRGLMEAPAILGALLFTLGALPSFWLRHDHYLWVHAFVPLVFHLADRYGETGRVRFAAYAAAAAALAVLGGAFQYGLLLLLVGAAWLFVRRGRSAWPAVGAYLLIATGLTMARWWPLAGYMATVARDTAADRLFWYPPWHLPTLIAPMLFQDPVGQPWAYFLPRSSQTVFGLFPSARADYAEATVSVGAVGFLLIVLAWRRCAGTWARAYRNAGGLLLLGTMLAPLVVLFWPGFTATGVGRLNLLTTFALAALAAKGFEDLLTMGRGEHHDLRERAARVVGRIALGGAIVATMLFILWTGRAWIAAIARDHLAGELPPFRDFGAHLLGPAVLVPLLALGVGAWLIYGRAKKVLAPIHLVALVLVVAGIEILVPTLRVNRSWPLEWAFPPSAEAHLPPPSPTRVLPVSKRVLPGNTPLMYGRRTALGYLSAIPRDYAEALYRGGPGPKRCAALPAADGADAARLLADGTYDGTRWRSIHREHDPDVRASNRYPGWRASVDGEDREIVAHAGWAMRVEPPPAPGQTVTWVFTAPRLRSGLAVGALTGIGLLGALILGWRRRRGRRP